MAHDELLRLLGTSGDPEQDITTTGDGTARFVGKGKTFLAVARVGGDIRGTSPTLTLTINQSANGTTSFASIASIALSATEQVGYISGSTPRYEVPGSEPLTATFTTTQDYIRCSYTVGGTSPAFDDVSCELIPVHAPLFKRSGT